MSPQELATFFSFSHLAVTIETLTVVRRVCGRVLWLQLAVGPVSSSHSEECSGSGSFKSCDPWRLESIDNRFPSWICWNFVCSHYGRGTRFPAEHLVVIQVSHRDVLFHNTASLVTNFWKSWRIEALTLCLGASCLQPGVDWERQWSLEVVNGEASGWIIQCVLSSPVLSERQRGLQSPFTGRGSSERSRGIMVCLCLRQGFNDGAAETEQNRSVSLLVWHKVQKYSKVWKSIVNSFYFFLPPRGTAVIGT